MKLTTKIIGMLFLIFAVLTALVSQYFIVLGNVDRLIVEYDAIVAAGVSIDDYYYNIRQQKRIEIGAYIERALSTSIVVSSVIGAIFLILGIVISKSISSPVGKFAALIREVVRGNTKVKKGDAKTGNTEICALTDEMYAFTDTLASYIDEIGDVLKGLSEGNLHGKIDREYLGDFDTIKQSINAILAQLSNTMDDIGRVADSVAKASAGLSDSSEALTSGVMMQVQSMQKLAVGINDVDEQSEKNSLSAEKAADLVRSSKSRAEAGKQDMKILLAAMDKLSDTSNSILEIIGAIEDIAFQINVLALNAAIEAARAGVHGKGFSVVAEEVRMLAAKSDEAAKKSSAIVQESIENIRDGMSRVKQMSGTLNTIVDDVVGISGVIIEIREASELQVNALHEINASMKQLNSIAQNALETSADTASASSNLNSHAEILHKKLSFFKTKLHTLPTVSEMLKGATVSNLVNTAGLKNVAHVKRSYNPGDIIIREGDELASSMFIVIEGSVDVYKAYGKANEMLLATLPPGSIVGEMALFLNAPRTATVIANDGAQLLEITHDDMFKFIDDNPQVAHQMVETLCLRLNNLLTVLGAY